MITLHLGRLVVRLYKPILWTAEYVHVYRRDRTRLGRVAGLNLIVGDVEIVL